MKFSQLIEYNRRNIFLEKSCTKYSRETSPRPFSKNSKSSISFEQFNFIQFVFIVCPCRGLSKYIETKVQTFLLLSHKEIFKNQIEV